MNNRIERNLCLASILSAFVGGVVGIKTGSILFYPLRLLTLLALPVLVFSSIPSLPRITRFAVRFFIIFFAYSIISLVWSPDMNLGIREIGTFFTGILLFILVVRNGENIDWYYKLMLIWATASIVLSALGVWEITTNKHLFIPDTESIDKFDSITQEIGWLCPRVVFGNQNNFAFFNSMTVLVLLGWTIQINNWIYRLVGILAVIGAIFMVIYSYSRAATLGLFVGITAFFIISLFSMINKKRITKAIMFSLTIILIFGIYAGFNIDLILSHIDLLAEKQSLSSGSHDIRQWYYMRALDAAIDSYGFGQGAGASTEVISGGSYHHHLMQLLGDYGIFVLIGHVFLLWAACCHLWKMLKIKELALWSNSLISSCIAFPILCAGPSGILGEGTYWLWLGLIVGFAGYAERIMKYNTVTILPNTYKRNCMKCMF